MIEIELKAWIEDPQKTKAIISDLAVFKHDFEKEDAYWYPIKQDPPHFGVRVRKETNGDETHTLVTFKVKEKQGSVEVNDEKEFEASDSEPLETLLNLLGFQVRARKHKKGWAWTSGLIRQDSSLIRQDSGLIQQDSGLIRQDSSLIRQDSSLIQQDSGLIQQDSGLIRQDSGLIQQDSSLIRQDSSLIRQDSSLIRQDSSLIQQDSGLIRQDSGLIRQDSGLIQQDSGLIQQDSGDITVELCEVHGLGWFVELEILALSADERTVEDARTRLLAFLKEIRVGEDKIESRYYTEMLHHLNKEE